MANPNSVQVNNKDYGGPLSRAITADSMLLCGWFKWPSAYNLAIAPFDLAGTNWYLASRIQFASNGNVTFREEIWDYPSWGWSSLMSNPTVDTGDEYYHGWVFLAVQVVFDGSNLTTRVWYRIGTGDLAGPDTVTKSYSTIHSGFSPSSSATLYISDEYVGSSDSVDTFDAIEVRVYSPKTSTPSNDDILAISNSLAADSTAWADWPLTWTTSAQTADQSGNARNLTVTSAALSQGSESPIAGPALNINRALFFG